MIIEKEENQIIGHWDFNGRNMIKDAACGRIEWLVAHNLKKIAQDESGWNRLYQDKKDNRYWELIYAQSEMHSGGPPSLFNITYEEARIKYHI